MKNHSSGEKYLDAAKRIFSHLAKAADANISIQLWDGSSIPPGDNAAAHWNISIKGPEVLEAIFVVYKFISRNIGNFRSHYYTGDFSEKVTYFL